MANNPYNNKIQLSDGTILIDLTQDTVTSTADIISGKVGHLADGSVVTGTGSGGGGVDAPTFTITWDDNWEEVISVTCDKTVQECYAYMQNDINSAITRETDQSQTETYVYSTVYMGETVSGLNYTVFGFSSPYYDIIYNSNNSISLVNPSEIGVALNVTENGTYYPSSNRIITEVNVNVPSSAPTLQAKTNIAPSTSSQTITPDTGYDGLSSVQINAMPIGTAGTPTATKGAVSNHSVSVTPSVTNTTGYITGSTKTGTAVTVSASELVSGSQTVTTNGTVDVTNLASVVVNVSGGGGASNVITGEFTVPAYSSSVKQVQISIPYTGTGYPVAGMIYVKNGAYNSTGASTWYNGIKRYAIGFLSFAKSNTTVAPSFTSGSDDAVTLTCIYKNSTSTADSYTRTSSMSTPLFGTSNPASNSAFCIKFKGDTKTMVASIGNGSASTYGLYPEVTYVYHIIYSS